MTGLFLGILAASLAGSPHCAGMCGAFAWMAAPGASPRRAVAVYHLSRLAGYLMLGAVAGALGDVAGRFGALAGIGRAAAMVAGACMVAGGAAGLLGASGLRLPGHGRPAGGFMLAAAMRVRAANALTRAAVIGAATAMLPCGLLYTFVAVAAASGHAWSGAVMMLVFWTGSIPAFAFLATAARRATGPLGRRLPLVTASALIIVGVLTMFGRMTIHEHVGAALRGHLSTSAILRAGTAARPYTP
jgi:sulfite exporter TauE/SafE